MEGSSIYFVKLEQVAVLPCLLCHSFPAATRLYLILLPFSTLPSLTASPYFATIIPMTLVLFYSLLLGCEKV